jgi:hypothetical protein
LAKTKLRPSAVFFRGDPGFPKSRGPVKKSGFNVPLTSLDLGESLWKQCAAAVRFLRRHQAELQRLRRFGLTRAALDFGLYDRATAKHPWPSYALSRELVSMAGKFKFDIVLSFYGPG